MKIQEFRDLLKSADRDKLEKAFAECYKQFSKAKKEEIDLLVQDILSGNEKKKAEKGKTANFEELESQYYERAVQCLWDLYGVLCRGCEVYLFSSDDPFASVRWEQEELYHLLVKKTFQLGYTRENIRKVLPLCASGGLSRTNLYAMNQLALLSELKTSDVKYMAIEEAKKLIEQAGNALKKTDYYSTDAYYRRRKE